MRVHATAAQCASHSHPRPRWPPSATARYAGAAVGRGCTSSSVPSRSPATRSPPSSTFGVTERYAIFAARPAVASPTGSLLLLSLEPGTASISVTLPPSSLPQCVSVVSTEPTLGSSSTSRPRSVAWLSSAIRSSGPQRICPLRIRTVQPKPGAAAAHNSSDIRFAACTAPLAAWDSLLARACGKLAA